MVYNTVSVKQVIAKVMTDNNIQEETHRIPDMIEWCGEALEKIGAFPQLDTVVTGKEGVPLLEINNYQTLLPSGLHTIIQAVYTETGNYPFSAMRYGTGSFDTKKGITTSAGVSREEYNNETSFTTDVTYVVVGNYMKFNVPTGYVMLAYTTIPLDEEGFPVVPDNIGFIDALYWYITMKLLYPKWAEGRVRDAVYYDARSSWNYYRKQAYGNAMMPNGDQLTAIKNTWNKLIPEFNDQNTFFSTTGEKQIKYNTNGASYTHIL